MSIAMEKNDGMFVNTDGFPKIYPPDSEGGWRAEWYENAVLLLTDHEVVLRAQVMETMIYG